MKHQIVLVGGQVLPLYIGIKEFKPDNIHFIVTKESVDRLSSLKPFLTNISFTESFCDPFDFISVKSICKSIVDKIGANDEVYFNITGGTKVMVLAVQALIHEQNLHGFYINQDDKLLEIPEYAVRELSCKIATSEFFELSGHNTYRFKSISDYSSEDFKASSRIMSFCIRDYRYKLIMGHLSRNFKDSNSPIPDSGNFTVGKKIDFSWTVDTIEIKEKNRSLHKFSSKIVNQLFFNSAWWELIVAQEINKWRKVKELHIQFELPFKTDSLHLKNEIDILINVGSKLIFVECKSGRVKQEDINKMKVVKDTYGGIISKSILVSFYMPAIGIIEKCKELGIDLFYLFDDKKEVNTIDRLPGALDQLVRKTSF